VETVVPMVSLPADTSAPTADEERATVLQALDEARLPPYSTQDDYYDVVLFIGYICTYTIQWPLTPVVCYLNNNLELRSDLVKINNAFRRTVPRKHKSIGAWEDCITFSVFAAIPMVVTFASISARTAEIFFLVRAQRQTPPPPPPPSPKHSTRPPLPKHSANALAAAAAAHKPRDSALRAHRGSASAPDSVAARGPRASSGQGGAAQAEEPCAPQMREEGGASALEGSAPQRCAVVS
jgi:hypothetical protein